MPSEREHRNRMHGAPKHGGHHPQQSGVPQFSHVSVVPVGVSCFDQVEASKRLLQQNAGAECFNGATLEKGHIIRTEQVVPSRDEMENHPPSKRRDKHEFREQEGEEMHREKNFEVGGQLITSHEDFSVEIMLTPGRGDMPVSAFSVCCSSLLFDQPASSKRAGAKDVARSFKHGRSMLLHEDAPMCVEKFIFMSAKDVSPRQLWEVRRTRCGTGLADVSRNPALDRPILDHHQGTAKFA